MRFSSTAEYRKLKTCPSAEAMLLHDEARSAGWQKESVAAHLAACDFCGAEMQMLTRHPPREWASPSSVCEIPLTLRRLAEDLMAGPSLNRARFVETIYEIERLTLTDA
ncbi:MAG TPA: hypothetical protein VM934_04610 [Pyrinomonadaceae bacterium]|jgi:hypothetical protein|nr:hypothetical protein [Pyrinomonadaceae bacterium]